MVLSMEQIQEQAPAVFSTQPKATTSNKYEFFNTYNVIGELATKDFYPVEVQQVKPRKVSPLHAPHLVKFESPKLYADDFKPQIIVTNAHTGTQSFRMHVGIFRFACANGLIVADQSLDYLKVNHIHHTYQDLLDLINLSINSIDTKVKLVETFKNRNMDIEDIQEFIKNAVATRFKDCPEPLSLGWVRRNEDKKQNLWTVLNVMQENLIKGMNKDEFPHLSKSIRPVKSINRQVQINKDLWDLALCYN